MTSLQESLDRASIYVKGVSLDLADSGAVADARSLRIVSWNIERGYHPERIADALAQLQPDIACLQEVDWGNQRTGYRDVLQVLAERIGMVGLYGIEFLEIASTQRPVKLAGGGVTGNALLSRLPARKAYRVEIPQPLDWQSGPEDANLSRWTRRQLRREQRLGRRFAIAGEFMWNGRPLLVCSAHFEDKLGGVEGRWAQFEAVARDVERRCDAEVIRVIAGDFNTFDSRIARMLTLDNDQTALGRPANVSEAAWWKQALLPATGYSDPFAPTAWTLRIGPFFRAKLDWITLKGGVVRDFGRGPFASSDHRLIWVDLEARDQA